MKKILQRIKRKYLSYSRSDRNGLLFLAGLLLISVFVNSLVDYLPSKRGSDFSEIKRKIKQWKAEQMKKSTIAQQTLFPFNPNKVTGEQLDSLDISEQIKRNIISYRQAGGEFKNADDLRKIYGMTDSVYNAIKEYILIASKKTIIQLQKPDDSKELILDYFDPNAVTVAELKSLGFSEYQATNLAGYRSSGGKFRKPEDLLKIYGIDSAMFLNVKPFIVLDSTVELVEKPTAVTQPVELNRADSSQLVSLPGVGSVYAKRILRYRDLLGGFYSPNQLLEVYNFPSETFSQIEAYVYTDTLQIKQLRINFSEYTELLRHPYLSKTQVTQIINTREKKGAFTNLSELSSLQGFDDETIKRIAPYLTCR